MPCQKLPWRNISEKSPSQNASFLSHISSLDMDTPLSPNDLQTEFNMFYDTACQLLSQFYPERTITVISRDHKYIKLATKASLRRKNRLMHAGRSRRGQRTGGAYRQRHSHQLQVAAQQIEWQGRLQGHVGGGKAGHWQEAGKVDGVTDTSFNCISISTDTGYLAKQRICIGVGSVQNAGFPSHYSNWVRLTPISQRQSSVSRLPVFSTCHFRRQPCRLSGRLLIYDLFPR